MNEVIEVESIPTKIRYKGIIWVPESKDEAVDIPLKTNNNNDTNIINDVNKIDKVDKNFTTPTKKPVKHGNPKKSYIVKWIEKKHSRDVFTLDQFYNVYPKLKKERAGRERVDKIINDMVCDGVIEQWRKDKKFKDGSFRVLK